MQTQPQTPIEKAVAISGGIAHLSEICGVSYQAVYKWVKRGTVPASRCRLVEAATGINRSELNPEIFGKSDSNRRTKNQKQG